MHEHEQGVSHVAPPPLLYAAGLGLGLLASRLRPAPLLPGFLRLPRRLIGAALIAGGLGTGLWGVTTMLSHDTTPDPRHPPSTLVVEGPFQYSRNPLYVSMTAIYLGVTLLRNSRWAALVLPGILTLMRDGVIAHEETYLEGRFGEEYKAYTQQTPRWL